MQIQSSGFKDWAERQKGWSTCLTWMMSPLCPTQAPTLMALKPSTAGIKQHGITGPWLWTPPSHTSRPVLARTGPLDHKALYLKLDTSTKLDTKTSTWPGGSYYKITIPGDRVFVPKYCQCPNYTFCPWNSLPESMLHALDTFTRQRSDLSNSHKSKIQ